MVLTGKARPFCEALKDEGLLCKETHENVIRFAPAAGHHEGRDRLGGGEDREGRSVGIKDSGSGSGFTACLAILDS